MIPLRRNKYFLMHKDTVHQYNTGRVEMLDKGGRPKVYQMPTIYKGKFLEALGQHGISYKKVGEHYILRLQEKSRRPIGPEKVIVNPEKVVYETFHA